MRRTIYICDWECGTQVMSYDEEGAFCEELLTWKRIEGTGELLCPGCVIERDLAIANARVGRRKLCTSTA